ncbi:NAD(P)H-dependent oxidoreductase [Streptomyces griseoincarnatus]|uniref:NAD(P)H-dependent oxidoreductase n=1 Tax=Streptomyces griseoincarnatus TaxID=29305 RepID=A0ABT0W711_STRGI|nr:MULTISPECIES: NAD(P)H-dependent oxidoreductase [Streptomyces]MBJ6613797.1 NAD(P)H-dependent oxidoreductase [Streptomyces sp. I3(2020)]MBJ6628850.1 NAD(P)H-dependent oxidoreductase [Streptomyces sp. I4(2020)]MCM2517988.1 NAD(P)H-dependent oxidoreductase [Streptomyces griseoincarnatus]
MHTLLVAANPDPGSLTHHVLGRLEAALQPGSVEIADLSEERFDPRFTPADRRAYHEGGNYPADVMAEHRRLERATDLVLVFPVYWWSMPALLKGWIDRVFVNGWAFEHSPASGLRPKLQHLTTHLLPIAGDDSGAYERHGYESALRTQIEHGVVDYCGSRRGRTAFIYKSEQLSPEATMRGVDRAVRSISEAIQVRLAG